jgi:hypothetical protein
VLVITSTVVCYVGAVGQITQQNWRVILRCLWMSTARRAFLTVSMSNLTSSSIEENACTCWFSQYKCNQLCFNVMFIGLAQDRGFCVSGNEPSVLHKFPGSSWVVAQLAASREGLSSKQLYPRGISNRGTW